MTYRVFGFVLRSRKWAQLDLTFLNYENVMNRKNIQNAFQRLVLPEGHKKMVKALVTQHFRDKEMSFGREGQFDLIRGRGKGLIILLHGAPSVGKTTTAKGVAEMFNKPLFQITCGDLGTTGNGVQAELEKNFTLASRWGCILLLDEADVFLAQRERKDFIRNGLVAVFLRVLEYYPGILFLTTNRVGDFAEAFASRIHMSLYYPELDKEKTRLVFELNLDLIKARFKSEGRNIRFDHSAIMNFAEEHFKKHKCGRWNGRQIRNACQTALSLAEFEAQKETTGPRSEDKVNVFLTLEHFQIVQQAYLDFSKYLGEVFGTEGNQRAQENRLRAAQNGTDDVPSALMQRAEKVSGRGRMSTDDGMRPAAERYESGYNPPTRYANPYHQSAAEGYRQDVHPPHLMNPGGRTGFEGVPCGPTAAYAYDNMTTRLPPSYTLNSQTMHNPQTQHPSVQEEVWAGTNAGDTYSSHAHMAQSQQHYSYLRHPNVGNTPSYPQSNE